MIGIQVLRMDEAGAESSLIPGYGVSSVQLLCYITSFRILISKNGIKEGIVFLIMNCCKSTRTVD